MGSSVFAGLDDGDADHRGDEVDGVDDKWKEDAA